MIGKKIFDIDIIIQESEELLNKESLDFKDKTNYKKKCDSFYIELINQNINSIITDLAQQGIEYDITKVRNPLFRWLNNKFTEARDNISFNAPCLKKKTDSDYYKTYVFWTKQKLLGIKTHLNKLN